MALFGRSPRMSHSIGGHCLPDKTSLSHKNSGFRCDSMLMMTMLIVMGRPLTSTKHHHHHYRGPLGRRFSPTISISFRKEDCYKWGDGSRSWSPAQCAFHRHAGNRPMALCVCVRELINKSFQVGEEEKNFLKRKIDYTHKA